MASLKDVLAALKDTDKVSSVSITFTNRDYMSYKDCEVSVSYRNDTRLTFSSVPMRGHLYGAQDISPEPWKVTAFLSSGDVDTFIASLMLNTHDDLGVDLWYRNHSGEFYADTNVITQAVTFKVRLKDAPRTGWARYLNLTVDGLSAYGYNPLININ